MSRAQEEDSSYWSDMNEGFKLYFLWRSLTNIIYQHFVKSINGCIMRKYISWKPHFIGIFTHVKIALCSAHVHPPANNEGNFYFLTSTIFNKHFHRERSKFYLISDFFQKFIHFGLYWHPQGTLIPHPTWIPSNPIYLRWRFLNDLEVS